ncbi:MAG: acyl-CoA thioesterase [Planctomycetaceae bacterium]|jgi:acyl-CoA thioester hydrolase
MLISELSEPVRSKLNGYHTATTIPVQWGDQDAFGHVNNVVYFRWLESARIDFLAACPSSVTMAGSGPGPIVASLTCDYRRQLHFPDDVIIGSRVDRIGRSSVDLGHAILSRQQGEIVAEGRCVIVVYDYTRQRVCRIPDDLRAAFESSLAISDQTGAEQ